MKIRYRFECSDEISSIDVYGTKDKKLIIDAILKDIFGETEPSCFLQQVPENAKISEETIVIFKRIYKNKFQLTKKPPKKKAAIVKRKRRWRSRSPIFKRRRWIENGR